jgi:hypothetical protein
MALRTHRGLVRIRRFVLGGALLVALDVAFAAIEVTEVIEPNLGTWFSGAPGRQFILNTDETVGGANAADYLVGALSGQIEVRKTQGPGSANITADNFSGGGTGVTINAVPCRWHDQPQTICDAPGITVALQATRILYIGVDISTTQVHVGGDTADAMYDITVTLL